MRCPAGHPDRSRDSCPADHHLHRKPSGQRSLQQPVHRRGQRHLRSGGDLHLLRRLHQLRSHLHRDQRAGVCSVIANQPGNANYAAAQQVTQTVAATPASQTITFTTNPPASAPYNSQFTVAASATSGLAVTFTSSGACTNSGATYTVASGAGVCSVIANQAGNADYAAAQQVTQTVNAAVLTANVCPTGQTTPAPCSETFTLAFNIPAGTTIASVNILTSGAPNLDFQARGGRYQHHPLHPSDLSLRDHLHGGRDLCAALPRRAHRRGADPRRQRERTRGNQHLRNRARLQRSHSAPPISPR